MVHNFTRKDANCSSSYQDRNRNGTHFNLVLIRPGVPVKHRKMEDVNRLLTFYFGNGWKEIPDPYFYNNIINRHTTDKTSKDELEGGIMEDIDVIYIYLWI